MPDLRNGGPSFWADQIRGGAPEFGEGAEVVTGNSIDVTDIFGNDSHTGTATVVGQDITVALAGTVAMVDNADVVSVRNSAVSDSKNAAALITNGILQGVDLAATVAMVDNADVVAVRNSAGADSHNGTAVVALGVITGVDLAATVAMVDGTDTPPIQNSAGALAQTGTVVVTAGVLTAARLPATATIVANSGTIAQLSDSTNVANGRVTGTATVATGVLSNVQLPTTAKIIKTATAYPLSAAPTGTWVSQITFTINASGVITGAVLS